MPKLIIRDGHAFSVYSDKFAPIARALGAVHIERATDVEWNDTTQEWEATLRNTGTIITHGPNRAEVIRQEVEFLEKEVIR